MADPATSRAGELAGKVALVTGGSGGIGSAIVRALSTRGATLMIAYHQNSQGAHSLQRELRSAGGTADCHSADLSNPAQARALVEETIKRMGDLHVLVNCAGITSDRTLQKMTPEQWENVLQLDLSAIFHCTQAAIPALVKNRGSIVNISSIVGETGAFGQTNYAAAKAGVIGFTKSLAFELARHGVTVNAVCPGYIDTRMLQTVPEKVREQIKERIPIGRFGTAEEVAAVVRFLVTEGTYITGQAINVNGGLYG